MKTNAAGPLFYDSWEECWAAQKQPEKRLGRILDAVGVTLRKNVPTEIRPVLFYYALHRLDRPFSRPGLRRVARDLWTGRKKVKAALEEADARGWLDKYRRFGPKKGMSSFVRLNSLRIHGNRHGAFGPIYYPRALRHIAAARRVLINGDSTKLPHVERFALAVILVASAMRGYVNLDDRWLASRLNKSRQTARRMIRNLRDKGFIVTAEASKGRIKVAPLETVHVQCTPRNLVDLVRDHRGEGKPQTFSRSKENPLLLGSKKNRTLSRSRGKPTLFSPGKRTFHPFFPGKENSSPPREEEAQEPIQILRSPPVKKPKKPPPLPDFRETKACQSVLRKWKTDLADDKAERESRKRAGLPPLPPPGPKEDPWEPDEDTPFSPEELKAVSKSCLGILKERAERDRLLKEFDQRERNQK